MLDLQSKLGVCIDDFRLNAKEGLVRAAHLGYRVVEVGAVTGQLTPAKLDFSGRRHLRRYVSSLGLSLVALGADSGGARLSDPRIAEQSVDQTKRILELAADLEIPVVSAPIGKPAFKNSDQYKLIREALAHIGDHADRVGRQFAIETASGDIKAIDDFLKDLNCGHLKVCYDPGALLIDGQEVMSGIEVLADDIVLSHLRDARLGSPPQAGRETNLGDGQLNVLAYLAQLYQAGYRGPQIIRRAHSADPYTDLETCKKYIDSIVQC